MAKKPRYRARVVSWRSFEWHELLRQGWREHRVLVYAGGNAVSTMIRLA